jgi:hypothetical protein
MSSSWSRAKVSVTGMALSMVDILKWPFFNMENEVSNQIWGHMFRHHLHHLKMGDGKPTG